MKRIFYILLLVLTPLAEASDYVVSSNLAHLIKGVGEISLERKVRDHWSVGLSIQAGKSDGFNKYDVFGGYLKTSLFLDQHAYQTGPYIEATLGYHNINLEDGAQDVGIWERPEFMDCTMSITAPSTGFNLGYHKQNNGWNWSADFGFAWLLIPAEMTCNMLGYGSGEVYDEEGTLIGYNSGVNYDEVDTIRFLGSDVEWSIPVTGLKFGFSIGYNL